MPNNTIDTTDTIERAAATRPRRDPHKKLAMVTAGAILALSMLVTGPQPAYAAANGYVPASAPVYRCPWRGCAVSWVTQYNAWLPFDCWTDSNAAGPTERWFKISGNAGWIQAWRVTRQPSLPRC